MKLLVLGSTGQLGGDLVRAAARRPGLSTLTPDRATLDLSSLASIEAALADLDFDVAVNCAAFTAVDAAETDAEAAFAVNAYAVERVARSCARAGRRLVQVSTDYVFDGESDTPYGPEHAPGPINVYGASKLAGERLALREHGEGTVVVRTSSVFGHGPPGRGADAGTGTRTGEGRTRKPGNFVETMLRLAGERDRLRVVDDITMAPTYAPDLAEAILELVEREAEAGVYHVTNRGSATWHAFACAILEMAGLDTPVDAVPAAEYPTAARRPRYSVLDTSRAERVVGALPRWEDGLRRYLG